MHQTPIIVVTSGTINLNVDAGLVALSSIGYFVWNDLNENNGIQDVGGTGISGVFVNVLINFKWINLLLILYENAPTQFGIE